MTTPTPPKTESEQGAVSPARDKDGVTILYPGATCDCGAKITRFIFNEIDTFTANCPTCGQENVLKIVTPPSAIAPTASGHA